eukprot:sb/3469242/
MTSSDRYRVVPAKPDRVQEIVAMMGHFYTEEPWSIICPLYRYPLWDQGFIAPIAGSGYTVMAVDTETGEVVGCRLGDVNKPSYPLVVSLWKWLHSTIVSILFWLLASVEDRQAVFTRLPLLFSVAGYDKTRFFERFSTDKILSDTFLVVHPDHRGNGLGETLVVESERLAKEKGCTHGISIGTGVYSQAIFKKLGYEVEREVRYDEIKQADGSQLPRLDKIPPVHKSLLLFSRAL